MQSIVSLGEIRLCLFKALFLYILAIFIVYVIIPERKGLELFAGQSEVAQNVLYKMQLTNQSPSKKKKTHVLKILFGILNPYYAFLRRRRKKALRWFRNRQV